MLTPSSASSPSPAPRQITAQNFPRPGDLAISSVWAEASFDLASTNGVFSNLAFNPGYVSSAFGEPMVDGVNTSALEVRGATMPGGNIFISVDNDDSNPLFVMSFDYTGSADGLRNVGLFGGGGFSLVGQNSIAFVDPANPLFGAVEFYQNAGLSTRSFAIEIVPAPGTAACLAIAGLAATRRRR